MKKNPNPDVFLLSPHTARAFYGLPTALLYLKYYLEDHGYCVRMADFAHHDSSAEIMSEIRQHPRPIVGITAYTNNRFNAYQLVRSIKEANHNSVVVVGGHHFGFLAEETLTELPEVDVVVRGEGEITLKEVCDAVNSKSGVSTVAGISYRDNGACVHTMERPVSGSIDQLRYFDPNDTESLQTYSLLANTKVLGARGFTVLASRGCPNRCVFCSISSHKARFRGVDSILDEIAAKIRITGSRMVSFADSSLTLNAQFLNELCQGIIRRNMRIHWDCYSRVDIDPSMLGIMRQAGLVSMNIGLESGSPKVLKSIRKHIDVSQFMTFCRNAHRLGIKLYVFCLISLPDETTDDFLMTMDLIKKTYPHIYKAGVQATRILPDAALHEIARERGLLPEGFSWFKPYDFKDDYEIQTATYMSIPPYLEHLSPGDINRLMYEFNQIRRSNNTSADELLRAIKNEFKMKTVKELSLQRLKQKVHTAASMLSGLKAKQKKDFYYSKEN